LQNGSNTTFDVHGFAPYLPVVYFLTVFTSITLIALVIVSKTTQTALRRIAEFGVIAIASTAASPIAWEHHYGILLPLFAWILPQITHLQEVRGASTLLLIAFVLCADDWCITNLLAGRISVECSSVHITDRSGDFVRLSAKILTCQARRFDPIGTRTKYSTLGVDIASC
jgi:ABC-type amino acid transport substrate-binding protein